ncbi:flagellar basal-body MS-ring/collar protein FliF [Paenibacillus spongiae]|uniref:Flagellar M-ring protein n=1 Tax=Paenibacillus spongiae TaxID=2909671 RepID=A0ABY5SFE1_9BACL|nr:flagellar basal-body MS-ring/collar protein FliF [Paenibacillus spongiae]UVI32494.1 flagellar M-ring protein FliF [Paenibacillus spongiae]
MNEKLNQYRGRLSQYWSGVGKKQRIWLGATAGVLLISVILLTVIFSKTEYELAFRDLDSTDAAAVMSYLDGSGIPYKLSDAGTSISVPAAEAAKAKVEAGSQGLIQNGSMGFAAFNEGSSPFGATDREFDVKYRSALNGEIQQLLNGMQGVQKSNVLVTLPEESVFLSTEEQEPASASIMITFKPGYRPTQKEVDGYYNLVKTAVPKLNVADITISSPEGELIASNEVGGNGSAMALETHFQIQRKYENDLKRNIQQFLSPMVGMNNLVVSVSSSINFDKKMTDEDLVKPLDDNNNNGIIISEQTNSKTATGSNGAGGVVGTGETDVPGYQAADGSGTTNTEENSRTTNYDVNRIKNQIQSGPYVIKDLSISVAVEKSRLNDEAKKDINAYLTSLVRSQLVESGQNVTDDALVAKKVSLIAQTFAEGSGATAVTGLSTPWMIGIGLAALALIGGLGFVVLRRRKRANQEEEVIVPGKLEYPTIDLDSANNESQVRKQLDTLAKRKPEEFVNLLRTWLVDE